jgi:hypothetical protein
MPQWMLPGADGSMIDGVCREMIRMRLVSGTGQNVRRVIMLATGVPALAACGGGGGSDPGRSGGSQGTAFYQIAAGDLDEDGRTDLAAIAVIYDGDSGAPDPAEIQVILQDPVEAGRFAPAIRSTTGAGAGAIEVAVPGTFAPARRLLDSRRTYPASSNVQCIAVNDCDGLEAT